MMAPPFMFSTVILVGMPGATPSVGSIPSLASSLHAVRRNKPSRIADKRLVILDL